MSHFRSRRSSTSGVARRALAALATGALVSGAVAFTPLAAQAADGGAITDAVFEWGISNEAGGGAFFGGCNFLSAGAAGDTGSSRLWTEADGFYKTVEGSVSITKDGADDTRVTPTWATKCQTAAGTNVSAASTASKTGNAVRIADGEGSVAADGSVDIAWDGDFTIVFYGGLTYWSVSDPVLSVDADGTGSVTATASGYGASMDDPDKWVPIAPEEIVLANLSDVEASDTGFTVLPDYLGVTVDIASGTPQSTTAATWGSFPQSFVDFNVQTGQSSYWYSSGGARDAAKPAVPLSVGYTVAPTPAPAFTTQPQSQTVTTADAVELTAAASDAAAYQWQSTATGSDSWADIPGATSATHAFTASAATGMQYRVIATGAGGSATSQIATVSVTVPTPVVEVSKTTGLLSTGEVVTVSGTGFLPNAPLTSGTRPPLAGQFTGAYIALASRVAADGSGLTNHTNSLSEYTTWAVRQENLAAIGGSGSIIAADGTFRVQIRAEDLELAEGREWGIRTYAAGGANYPAFSTFTPLSFVDPLTTAVPAIAGTPKVGASVSATTGAWTSGTAFRYQWLVGGKAVSGATKSTYTPAAADRGKSLTVTVTGSKAGYASAATTSPAKTVAAGTLTAKVPTLSGTAKVGVKLTAKPGTWTSGTTLRYQWHVSGKAVSGATKSTYTPKAGDRGKTVKVTVTGSKAGYTTVAKTSSVKKIAAGTLTSKSPSISGTAKAGKKLTAKTGTWTSGTSFRYQWYVSGKAVAGATKSTYTVRSADRGKTVKVKVTGSKSGYTTVTKTSAGKKVAR